MISAPHFSTDANAREMFVRLVKTNPVNAVGIVLQAGLSILPEDLQTPHLDTLERCPPEGQAAYAFEHAASINQEKAARQLVRNQENIRRHGSERKARATAEERATFVHDRGEQLRREYAAKLEAEWFAAAQREAAVKFDAPAPAPEPPREEPTAPKRSRKAAA